MMHPKNRAGDGSKKRFQRVRSDHARELAEDYTEMILELESVRQPVRQTELSRRLGVSHVTVLRTIERLERDGFVVRSRGAGIVLTDRGRRLAEASRRRHEVVLRFLCWLGVPEDVAEIDAEGIEHHVSATTLRRMEKAMSKAPTPAAGGD